MVVAGGVKQEENEETYQYRYPKIMRPSELGEDELIRAGVPVGFYKLPEPSHVLPHSAAPPGWIAVSVVSFDAGFHIPLHPSVAGVLTRWGVSPGQLTPNAWRALVGFCILCHERGVEFSVNLFAHWAAAKSVDASSTAPGYVRVFRRYYPERTNMSELLGLRCFDSSREARWFLLKLPPAAVAAVESRWRPFRPVAEEPLSPEEDKSWDRLVGGGRRTSVRRAEDVVRSPAFVEWLRAGFGGVLPPEHCWYRGAGGVDVSGNIAPQFPRRRAVDGAAGRAAKRTRVVDVDDDDQSSSSLPSAAAAAMAAVSNLVAAANGASESLKRRLEAEREASAGLRRSLEAA